MKTKKLLSLLLVITILLMSVSAIFNMFVGATSTEKNYYVKNGATGDGRNVDSPAGSIIQVIDSINADGLKTGDTANVFIIKRDDWNNVPTTPVGNTSNATKTVKHNMAHWFIESSPYDEVKPYEAKMVIQAYDKTETTYLAIGPYIGVNSNLMLGGDTEFKDVTVVMNRNSLDYWVFTNGYDLTWGKDSATGYMNNTIYGAASPWDGKIYNAIGFYEAVVKNNTITPSAGDITIKYDFGVGCNPGRFFAFPSNNATTTTFNGDVNFIFNNEKLSRVIYFGSKNSSNNANATIKGNLNVDIKAVTGIVAQKGTGTITVDGGFQIIAGADTVVNGFDSLSNINATAGKWYLNVSTTTSDLLSFTDTAGTFDVKEGHLAIATNTDTMAVTSSKNGKIVLEAGKYTITEGVPESKEVNYYVKNGGTGDGRTVNSPAGSIIQVIDSINADRLTAIDTANVFIIKRDDWDNVPTTPVGNTSNATQTVKHNMAHWFIESSPYDEVKPYEAKMVIQAYDKTETTYLAIGPYIGVNSNLMLGGDTEFKDVTVVMNRNSLDYWVFTNGHNLTWGKDSSTGYMNNTIYGAASPWDGKIYNALGFNEAVIKNNTITSSAGSVTLTYDYGVTYNPSRGMVFPSNNSTDTVFNGDVHFVYNNSQLTQTVTIGAKGSNTANATINKNLNFEFKKASNLTFKKGNGTIKVNGGVQVIADAVVTVNGWSDALQNINASNGIWYITDITTQDDIISLTEQAGVYSVKEGCDVIATNVETEQEYYPTEGMLELPAGTYTLTEGNRVPVVKSYYIKNGANGDGRSQETPAGSIVEVVDSINTDGLIEGDTANVFVIKRDDWNAIPATMIGNVTNENMTVKHNMASWYIASSQYDEIKSHKAKMVIQAYDNEKTTYLAIGPYIGQNSNLMLGGDTEFKDVTVVMNRNSLDYEIYANGHNVTWGKNSATGYLNSTVYTASLKQWDGVIYEANGFDNALVKNSSIPVYDDEFTLTYENERSNRGLYIPSYGESKVTFKKDVNIVFNNDKYVNNYFTFGSSESNANTEVTFNKNLNINVKSALELTLKQGTGNIHIKGGLQFITGTYTIINGSFDDLTNINADGGKWFITNNTDQPDLLAFSKNAGEYIVKEGFTAIAVNKVTKEEIRSKDGVLTLPAGTYTVTSPEAAAGAGMANNSKMLYFKNGTLQTHFAARMTPEIGATYRFTYSAFTTEEDDLEVRIVGNGNRGTVKNNLPVTKHEDHGTYYTNTYEFVITEEEMAASKADSGMVFVGVWIPIATEGYIFDLSVHKVEEPEKECFRNAKFKNGLDEWIWGWTVWFGYSGNIGKNLTEWTNNVDTVRLEDYDLKNIDRLIAELNIDDGEWWNPEDIIEKKDNAGYASINGKLVDQNNKPLKNTKLVFESSEKTYKAVTNSRGVFAIKDFVADFYELYAINDSGEKIFTGFSAVFADGDEATLTLTCDTSNVKVEDESETTTEPETDKTESGTLKGTVYTPKLKTVAGLKIYLEGIGEVVTDENGAFDFGEVAVGDYALYSVSENGEKNVFRTVTIKKDVDLSIKLKYETKEDTKVSADEKESSNLIMWLIIAGVLVVVGVGAVILVIALKRKIKS